jgi:hypothetical protein
MKTMAPVIHAAFAGLAFDTASNGAAFRNSGKEVDVFEADIKKGKGGSPALAALWRGRPELPLGDYVQH